jgi:hypothetical protein
MIFTVISQDLPRVQLDSQGVLEGKEMKTMGNLGEQPRTYYGFRNIPYAHTGQSNRFAVSSENHHMY